MIAVPFVGGGFEGDEMAAGNSFQALTALEAKPAQPRGATACVKCFLNTQELS